MSDKSARAGRSPFVDVTPVGRRAPSWIARQAAPKVDVRSLRPALLPQEFVAAMHEELDGGAPAMARELTKRRSTRPPAFAASLHPEPILGRRSSTSSMEAQAVRLNNSRPPSESAPFAAQLLQQQAEEVTDEARRLVHDALLDLANARAVLYETAAHQLAELATTIARRVIAHELSLNPAIVRNLVEEGMHALERQDRLFVRVGREFASLRDVLAAQLAGQSEHVDVVVDPTLADYGCVVETEHGWVDESVETRLATLLQALHADSGAP